MTRPPPDDHDGDDHDGVTDPKRPAGGGGPLAVDRDQHARRCKATTRSGKQCRAYAVADQRVCRMHGGSSPQARAAAQRRRAEREATALLGLVWDPDAAPVTDPVASLQRLAGRLEHAANVLGARIDTAGLDESTGGAWLRVLRELRQALEGMERLDLHSKVVQLEQDKADLVTGAFLAAIDVLQLPPGDRSLSIRTFLVGLGSDPAKVDRLASGRPEILAGEIDA